MKKVKTETTPRKPAAPEPDKAGQARCQGRDMEQPVLLAVTGMSPAIITETVWALATGGEPVIPQRVIVVTTTSGREKILRQLFEPLPRFEGRTAWEALRAALEQRGHDLSGRLRFGKTADDIRVITGLQPETNQSLELSDIRTAADSTATADFLLEQVRGIVENPDTPLIASIAGGRKTMGALLYACLTLIGRETDRLTHVLVSEPYESLPEFFFPGQPGGALAERGNAAHAYDPAKAEVELADIPFVALRNLFVRELGRRPGRFMNLVEFCQENVRKRVGENLRLEVETRQPYITVNGKRLKLSAREQVVMLFLARQAKSGAPPVEKFQNAIEPLNALMAELRKQADPADVTDWRRSLPEQFEDAVGEDAQLRRVLSNLRRKLAGLESDGASLSLCLPERGRFALAVPGPMIFIK